MTQAAPAPWPTEGARLLEPSISYALGAVLAVTPELLSRPTPCGEWDLWMLLRHACESLAAIGEGIEAGRVDLNPAAEDGDLTADPARAFRDRAAQVLVPRTGRHPLFAAPVTMPTTAGPSDRLAAFLGRTPRP